jgi:hypothetical protein
MFGQDPAPAASALFQALRWKVGEDRAAEAQKALDAGAVAQATPNHPFMLAVIERDGSAEGTEETQRWLNRLADLGISPDVRRTTTVHEMAQTCALSKACANLQPATVATLLARGADPSQGIGMLKTSMGEVAWKTIEATPRGTPLGDRDRRFVAILDQLIAAGMDMKTHGLTVLLTNLLLLHRSQAPAKEALMRPAFFQAAARTLCMAGVALPSDWSSAQRPMFGALTHMAKDDLAWLEVIDRAVDWDTPSRVGQPSLRQALSEEDPGVSAIWAAHRIRQQAHTVKPPLPSRSRRPLRG